MLLPLTSGLQARELDIKKAYQNVNFVKKSLEASRSTIDNITKDLFERAKCLADFVGVEPSKPRTCRGRQTQRENHEALTIANYFRISLIIPFVDHIINEISSRFGSAPITVTKGFSILSDFFLNHNADRWKEDFSEFALDKRDLPGVNSISPELLMWDTYWRNEYKGKLPSPISETLKNVCPMKASFPNIHAALRDMATIPVTSCKYERSVSVLRGLKTYLRNTICQNKLNGLSVMSIHRDIPIDFNDVITRFARKYPRRMELLGILEDDDNV